MHPNHQTLERFYTAFAALDADAMEACYAPEARFDDPVFHLQGRREVAGMWRMLCEGVRAKGRADWKLVYSGVSADATQGQAHWEAQYRFSKTGRMVLNRIDARMQFDPQGLIVVHRDAFDFWTWSRQALGLPGWLLGWTPLLRKQVRKQARAGLDRFLAMQPGGGGTA